MLRRRLIAASPAWLLVLPEPGDEAIWRDFLAWYRSRPVSDYNPRLSFLEDLRRRGAASAEVRRAGLLLERLVRERKEELQPLFFDRTYRAAEPRFNTLPNALLKDAVRAVQPGRALDIHMGQGRNALFLARLGWDVTGFDYSEEGVASARRAAAAEGLPVRALLRRHEDFEFAPAAWNLIVMTYAWVPVRASILTRIQDALAPGGLLVFEQMLETSGGENAAPWLPRPGEAPRLFHRLQVVRNEEVTARPDWSWRPERLVRFIGRKAAQP